MKALIVVDMQNDFITGSLPVPRALEIVGGISEMMHNYKAAGDLVVMTKCWHPAGHCSFVTNGGQWPVHCVRKTVGAFLQPALRVYADLIGAVIIHKGERADQEQYSGFDNPDLDAALHLRDIREIAVCGIARDYCVEATAKAAAALGYSVTILEDLCRSVS